MMQRRAFVVGMATMLAGPAMKAEAQSTGKVARVAWLGGGAGLSGVELQKAPHFRAFTRALNALGFAVGEKVVIEIRTVPPDRVEQYRDVAIRLVAERPDLIFANNPYSIAATVEATKTIPIVAIDFESDPVARGWAVTWAKPGGNLTGFFLDIPEMSGKQIEYLKDLKGSLTRVAVLGDPGVNDLQFQATETVARKAGLALHHLVVTSPDAIEPSIAKAARDRADALVVLSSPLVNSALNRIAASALRHALPAICTFVPRFAEVGGLLAYGADFQDFYRRAAAYVSAILQGSKAGDLPIQRPEKFQLVINAKTAKALNLPLPPSLLLRADQVIE
jgi:putative ABC transport system substrate-binding protein